MCNGTLKVAQCPHTDPHGQLVGVECLLVHLVLAFPSFPIFHILNTATERHLLQIYYLHIDCIDF